MKYLVETPTISQKCVNYKAAMLYFNRFIKMGYPRIEVKKICIDYYNNHYREKSIKVFCK